jgi:hypothetical protein
MAFGLRHYVKGLELMRRLSFADLRDEYQLRDALLLCFITITFEFYQGNKETAVRQAAAGIELLNNFHEKRFGTWPLKVADIPSTATIDSDIIATFTHLQTLLDLGERRGYKKHSSAEEENNKFLEQILSQFHDLDSARFSWVLASTVYWQGDRNHSKEDSDFLFDVANPGFAVGDMPLMSSIPVKQEQTPGLTSSSPSSPHPETKREGSNRWLKAFQPLYDRCHSKPPTTSNYQRATITMILYLQGKLRFDVSSSLEYDFVTESLELLPLAKELL